MIGFNRVSGVRAPFVTAALVAVPVLATLPAHAQDAELDAVHCSDAALGATEDDQGRLLVAGSAYDNRVLEWDDGHAHYGDLALARLLPDGAPDPGFGDRGNVVLDVADFDALSAIVVRGDSVYAAGTAATANGERSGPADLVLVRLDDGGRLDERFAEDGVLRLDLGGDESLAGLALAPGGGLYVAGTRVRDARSEGFVARLTAQGHLVAEYGQAGIAWLAPAAETSVLSIAAGPDGVRVAGRTGVSAESAVFAAALDSHGRRNPAFGEDGLARAAVAGATDASGVAFHGRSGRTVITVPRTAVDGGSEAVTIVFDSQGRVLAPRSGERVTPLPAGADLSSASAGWGGAVYLSGALYTEDDSAGDAWLARTTPAGAYDPRFAGGSVTAHPRLEYASYRDVVVSRSGVSVVGWDFSEAPERLAESDALVARYRHDGTLDDAFGSGGLLLHDFHSGDPVCAPSEHE